MEYSDRKVNRVEWNRNAKGFLDEWTWQFGEGPFEVVDQARVRSTPGVLGTGYTRTEISFEPGEWYWIKLPKTAHNYRPDEIIHCETTPFHSKWLNVLE